MLLTTSNKISFTQEQDLKQSSFVNIQQDHWEVEVTLPGGEMKWEGNKVVKGINDVSWTLKYVHANKLKYNNEHKLRKINEMKLYY